MANITKGYAYAFQELGVLYLKKKEDEGLDDIVPLLKIELFAYSYEKIWEEMSECDKMLAKLLINKKEYKREEILKLMGDKASNYSVYRDRLLKKASCTQNKAAFLCLCHILQTIQKSIVEYF